jgi:hypothetical protein
MSTRNIVKYLNAPGEGAMHASLLGALNALPAKIQSAPASQWIATIKALQNKGVKLLEIEDSRILNFLESREKQSLTRGELIQKVQDLQVTVKEVQLANPQFVSYSHGGRIGGARYHEILYVANSQRDNIQDRIDEIEWEMEDLNFDMARLSADPMAALKLADERAALIVDVAKAHTFEAHHFASEAKALGEKNIIAHGRESIIGDLYLIEEVQSDWAQKGRKKDWFNIPRGPFVTDTKAWAGLVVRRMLQRAASLPEVKRVAWIRGWARNGGANQPAPGDEPKDGLDDFYMKTVRSLVDKAIAGGGVKSALTTLHVGEKALREMPCFEMTPAVREQLKASQPVYSHANVVSSGPGMSEHDMRLVLKRCQHLLGSDKHVYFVKRVYDISTMREAAGSYMNKVIQISMRAHNPMMAMDHECFHFAWEHLLNRRERDVVQRDFAPGSEMNQKVIRALRKAGNHDAAHQCANSAEEAAAHGFSMWSSNRLDFGPDAPESEGIFSSLKRTITDVCVWLGAYINQEKCATAEDVFERFGSGMHGKQQIEEVARARPQMKA